MNFREILEREQAKLDGYTANAQAAIPRVAKAGELTMQCPACGGTGYQVRRLPHGNEHRTLCPHCSGEGQAPSPSGMTLLRFLAAAMTGSWGPPRPGTSEAEIAEFNRQVTQREAAAAAAALQAEQERRAKEMLYRAASAGTPGLGELAPEVKELLRRALVLAGLEPEQQEQPEP